MAIAISSRRKGPQGHEQRKGLYRELLTKTRKVVNQARRVCAEVGSLPRRKQAVVKPLNYRQNFRPKPPKSRTPRRSSSAGDSLHPVTVYRNSSGAYIQFMRPFSRSIETNCFKRGG